MSAQAFTRIETHPDGTTGIAGIVNGNWERIELLFTPTIPTSDASYQVFMKALTRNATLPATNGAVVQWDQVVSPPKLIHRPGYATVSTATPAIDFKGPVLNDITCSGDPTFSGTNMAAGWQASALVRAGGSTRTLTFPAWVFIGAAAPTTLASGKIALLELWASGTAAADVVARWTVQP